MLLLLPEKSCFFRKIGRDLLLRSVLDRGSITHIIRNDSGQKAREQDEARVQIAFLHQKLGTEQGSYAVSAAVDAVDEITDELIDKAGNAF